MARNGDIKTLAFTPVVRYSQMMRILIVAFAALLALAAPATAATPGASTGTATEIVNGGATLNGVVNPNKETTTYHFEWGTTTAYGSNTPDATVGGNAGKDVSAAITGLLANTTYHFRLVATNPSGTDTGNDATFTTSASPYTLPANTVSIAAAPNPVTFGAATTITGTVGGSNNAGVTVDLELTPSPFSAPFAKTGVSATTDAAGNYTMTIVPGLNTRYQAVAKTSPPVTSTQVEVKVRKRVSLRVRGHRLSGTVKPAHDGLVARIQRRTRTKKWKTVARVKLKASKTPGQSRYSKRVSRRGVYRVRVPADADHLRGTSRKRKVK
jgi:hypothetical protein